MAGLSPEQLRFLESHRVARLATVDDAGQPHVVPICFAHVDGVVYSAIDEKPKRVAASALRRLQNIAAHPEVCLVVDRYDEDWSRLAWLQIRGRASLVTDADERDRAIAGLRERYPQYRAMNLEDAPLIRIAPDGVVEWQAATASPAR